MLRSLFALLLVLAAAARAEDATLAVRDAWIREAPPNAAVLAGYAELVNDGAAPVVVVGASSPDFGSAELHSMTQVDGVMRMRPLERLVVAVGARSALAPGGNHLMLMAPKRALRAGDRVDVTFALEGGATVVATFDVRR